MSTKSINNDIGQFRFMAPCFAFVSKKGCRCLNSSLLCNDALRRYALQGQKIACRLWTTLMTLIGGFSFLADPLLPTSNPCMALQ